MARRSPSPVGSHKSSHRSRHNVGKSSRDRRDAQTHHRQRSRSPGSDRRDRDRDSQRASHRDSHRESQRDSYRRDDDTHRSSRRTHSSDRYRSADHSDRDRRRRSRERDQYERRDNDRRRRDDEYADLKHKGRREEDRDVSSRKANGKFRGDQSPQPSAPLQPSYQDEKAAKLAKLEAWKKQQSAKKEQERLQIEASGGARGLLNEMDKKAAESSPRTASPKSPITPATPQDIMTPASPAPYVGKFDPKEIAKRATANQAATVALGNDVAVPKHLKSSATLDFPMVGVQANQTKPDTLKLPDVSPNAGAEPLKAKGNLSGFGLGNKPQTEPEKQSSKRGLDFGDEESARKKLEKLPTPPPEQAVETQAAESDHEEDDEDIEMENAAGTEEEQAAAARAAAEKREERLVAESLEERAHPNVDHQTVRTQEGAVRVPMSEAVVSPAEADAEEEKEDLDPLEAFMKNLGSTEKASKAPGLSRVSNVKSKPQEPEALFSDDDDGLSTMDATPGDILEMAQKARSKKAKGIPTINHSEINYEPVQMDFYSEPADITEMSEEDITDLRLEAGITVKGADCPRPVLKFSQMGLGARSLDVIQKLGFEQPTPIQQQAIPAIMSGRDLIGIAKTGSGKTMAYLLPLFRHVSSQPPLKAKDGCIALVMCPTRELATQIFKECKPWLKALNLRAVCAYGGVPIKDQIGDLKKGAEIVVCTPGRMIDLLQANAGRVLSLNRTTYVVLDEADRMFDMGFEPSVVAILKNIRPQRQTVLLSATFSKAMESLARKTLRRPIEVLVGGRSVVAPEIEQRVEVREESSKLFRLLQLLGEIHEDEEASSLVFVATQVKAEELASQVLKKGYPCFTLHGGKDQEERDEVMQEFRNGIFPVLFATSVAARGLDCPRIKAVINLDVPNHLEDYIHRCGRTGRAGQKGVAVTFITEEQGQYAGNIAKALKQSGHEVPEDLQKLVESFQEKVKAGKEKVSGSGFGGKGLERLDQERDAARNRERKIYRTGDEPDEEEKKEEEVKEKIIIKAAGAPVAQPPSGLGGFDVDEVERSVKVVKTEIPVAGKVQDKMSSVSDAVAAINARLRKTGDISAQRQIDNKGPDAGAYHATLEINDFPQKARWAVTNRTNVAKILEATGTSITSKGIFYATGKAPQGPDEPPKLYILVEGDTEVQVESAMREMMRLLRDATTAALDSEARAPIGGRYSVV